MNANPENWGFFNAENGEEITRGWQGYECQARARAQAFANDMQKAIEFCNEDLDPDEAGDEGEIVEPEHE